MVCRNIIIPTVNRICMNLPLLSLFDFPVVKFTSNTTIMQIRYIPKRGRLAGKILTPHIYKNGNYVVSKDRFSEKQVIVNTLEEIYAYLVKGYGVRVSYKGKSPSLVFLKSLDIS